MSDILIKSYPDEFKLESFKGFTSGAFRKAWANIGEDLDDADLKEAGPKSMDHSRLVTERFYLCTRMKNTAAFSKTVGKNFMAKKKEDGDAEMSGSSSGDEHTDSDIDDEDKEDATTDPNARGLNPIQLQLVLRHFPMKGAKASSVTATGCDKAAKIDKEFAALYEALKLCIKRKCSDQMCKSGGKKCLYCRNPEITCDYSFTALSSDK